MQSIDNENAYSAAISAYKNNGSQLKNLDISDALYTLRIQY